MNKRIAVAGTGYVGLSIATLLAQHNHVVAVDIVPEKVEMINNRKSPIQDEYIEKYLAEKELDLTATLDGEAAYKDAEFVVIAAPTNYDSKKNYFDTSAVEAVIKLVMAVNPNAIMVIKSTIPVGYTASIREKMGSENIIFSPEFLRESKALYDNLYPSRIIVSTDGSERLNAAAKAFAELAEDSSGAREKLIVHNLRLVVYIAKKFESTGTGVEDLISIGTIGLIKAVNTFRPDKKIKLATYASRCIENEILMFLRKSSQYRNEISIDEPLNIDWDGNELLLSDVLGTDEDVVNKGIESEAERGMLREAVESLGGREKQIMQMRFGLLDGKEKTQKEVADLIGISQSYISRLEKKIIKNLKIELEKKY